jgi:hypothetical protein
VEDDELTRPLLPAAERRSTEAQYNLCEWCLFTPLAYLKGSSDSASELPDSKMLKLFLLNGFLSLLALAQTQTSVSPAVESIGIDLLDANRASYAFTISHLRLI